MLEYSVIAVLSVVIVLLIVIDRVKEKKAKHTLVNTIKEWEALKETFGVAVHPLIDSLITEESRFDACKTLIQQYLSTETKHNTLLASEEKLKKEYALLAKELNENKQRISGTSHQMRTSLSGLIGFASFLASTPLSEEQKEYCSYINDSTKELLALINAVPDIDSAAVNRHKVLGEHKTKRNTTPHILVVDDNRINQKLIGKVLEAMQVEASFANNGKEALELRMENRYDLIFMDVQMPVMDGVEATKQIRSFEKEQHVDPVMIVALTANTSKSERDNYLDAGMDDYASKPINIEEIKNIVSNLT